MLRRASIAAVVMVVAVAGTVAAQSSARFSDVEPSHEDFNAIEWAASVGVTVGYGDGTFRPEEPLSLRHASVFLARYYDEVLQADVSEDFTRGDMMRVLYQMAGSPVPATGEPGELVIGGPVPGWSGDVWVGDSKFGKVACATGDATARYDWSVPGWYTVVIWSAANPDSYLDGDHYSVILEVNGPKGASKRFHHFGTPDSASDFSVHVAEDPRADIDPGSVVLSFSSDGTWAATYSRPGAAPWIVTTKQLQQWAASVDCDRI